ncbi:MAG TPA: DNA-3-methyladenine glycosylase [Candidatus Acidoferrum sp.]|nr:DNA-3-methyladenine glycosylase [Candidatus Acidoferrum sp.]
MKKKLTRSFYARPTLEVARDLLGKYIVYRTPSELFAARIVEVEAYVGEQDPACHAAPGPTPRNQIMYGSPGFAYIYFIYGMYHCLNFVTEPKGHPAAVLLRAAEPDEGIPSMIERAPRSPHRTILSGPGKFCRAFGLTVKQNGLDLTGPTLFVEDRGEASPEIAQSPRIGIKNGVEHLWRFIDRNSEAVSCPRTMARRTYVRT